MKPSVTFAAAALSFATAAQASAPCEGVVRDRDSARALLALHDAKAHIVRSFSYDGWEIAQITLSNGTPVFMFLSPGKLVAQWRGAWTLDEVSQAKEWTVESAPGIPNQLARCFAVRVTREGQF